METITYLPDQRIQNLLNKENFKKGASQLF